MPLAPLPTTTTTTTTTTTHFSSPIPTHAVMLPVHVIYHWRELPQVSFLSLQNRSFVTTKVCLPHQNICLDKILFVATKYFCRNKSNTCPSQQKLCCDKHTFVATKNVFCRSKHVCHDKSKLFATKLCLSRQIFVKTKVCL